MLVMLKKRPFQPGRGSLTSSSSVSIERHLRTVASERDVAGAEGRRECSVRGRDPTRSEPAGSRPCARAKTSARPGSGGRHQQMGGPAGCGHNAVSTGPRPSCRGVLRLGRGSPCRRQGSSRRRDAARSGRSARALAPIRLRPGPLPRRRRRRVFGPMRARSNRDLLDGRPALVVGRRLELAERAHLRGRCKQAGLALRRESQLARRRQRAEAVEQSLHEIELRLRERDVEPDAARWDAVPPAVSST